MHSSMRPFRQALVEHRNAHPDKVSNLSRKPACPAFFSVRPYSSVITPEYHYLHTYDQILAPRQVSQPNASPRGLDAQHGGPAIVRLFCDICKKGGCSDRVTFKCRKNLSNSSLKPPPPDVPFCAGFRPPE
jgi:hypothetical protein